MQLCVRLAATNCSVPSVIPQLHCVLLDFNYFRKLVIIALKRADLHLVIY